MPVFEYDCPACHRRTDHLHRRQTLEGGEWVRHGEAPPDTVPCSRCGAAASRMVSAPKFRIARTNFYDLSAGRVFADEGEMRQWCRDNGVSEDTGGDTNEVERARYQAALEDERRSEAEFQDYADRLNHAPEFEDYRRLRDHGYFVDKAKERAERLGVDGAAFEHSDPTTELSKIPVNL